MVSKACVSSSGIQPGVRRDNRLLYARQSSHILESDAMKSMVSQVYEGDLSIYIYLWFCVKSEIGGYSYHFDLLSCGRK